MFGQEVGANFAWLVEIEIASYNNNNVSSFLKFSSLASSKYPTNPFTISELQDQEIGGFYVVHRRRVTDLKVPKL